MVDFPASPVSFQGCTRQKCIEVVQHPVSSSNLPLLGDFETSSLVRSALRPVLNKHRGNFVFFESGVREGCPAGT